ncbi:Cell division protein FtsH [Olavius algarvensis spirochete endosymbiont]|uniref:ATP-dependent zinc metalloprotease FtsH n=1 Tax=Olavius algarvensis spirochete endosymbiont TaxID=260710 RepID=UPI00036E320C|nr:ATP-dependent zinc metalloprotease FtsH [Olavius algarvensis spirochete endosymbiont]CAD7840827.1 MAG: Cell division-associated, ATP-dependent zinc metalloprotease FtsH [Olavius algarvensis spirochete endosymbiont]VDA99049.1 Cell division protein FtsH [Olavius algarvensis spirochete endosymbiont]
MNEEQEKEDNGSDWRELLKNSKRKMSNRDKNPKRKFRFSPWSLLLAVALVFAFNMFSLRNNDQGIPYSEFKALITNGSIKEVHYSGSSLVGYSYIRQETRGDAQSVLQGVMGDESSTLKTWKSERITDDPTLIPLMDDSGVVYKAIPEANNYFLDLLLRMVIPIVLMLFIWRFIARRMGGIGGSNVMSFGQNNAKIVAENDLTTRFKDVAGCDEAKDELVEIVDFLKSPTKYTSIGGKIPKGALLVGSPGTGKTLLARAVAGEAGVIFFRMSGADFVEMFVGVGAARVRDLFKQARTKAPCIIFIDELDAIGKSRAGSVTTNDEREQTLNQLLVEMDGFDSTSGVIILAATNRPEVLDPALLRPGRFDRQVVVDKPDQIGREAILRIHSVGVKLEEDLDLTDVAKATAGLAGADLANIVNEAALLAVRFGREKVTRDDFLEAIEKAAIGLQKKNKILNPHEREVTAYHETGHALVNVFTPNQHLVKKITIVPRGYGVMGYMLPVPEEERSFQTREELIGRIDVTLGGRAAEKIIYGTMSTGAGNDIAQATDIARSMVTRFGMSEKFAHVSLDKRPALYLGPDSYGQGREHAEETQRYIDEEITQIIGDAYKRVMALLGRHRKLLDEITVRLLDKETIERDELMELIKTDNLGKQDFETRRGADLKPSEKARSSGDARNKAIKERMAERRNAEEESARKAAEEKARRSIEAEVSDATE